MSFTSNVGKPAQTTFPAQCEMVVDHHVDVRCLKPCIGTVPEAGGTRVCGACAVQMEKESFVVSYHDEVRFVLVHPEMGVYLGTCLGLGFWSKLDPVGQLAAVTFENRTVADVIMRSWDNGRPDKVIIWPVMADWAVCVGGKPTFASIAACVATGLETWDPNEPLAV